MRTILQCGWLFTGFQSSAEPEQALVIEGARITYAGPRGALPQPGPDDRVIDHSRYFVMPGLSDVHTHLSYGNARSEEEVVYRFAREARHRA